MSKSNYQFESRKGKPSPKVLPPIVSPRTSKFPQAQLAPAFRSISQKLKTQNDKPEEIVRPATDNQPVIKKSQPTRPLQKVRQSALAVKEVLIRRLRQTPLSQKALKYQNPAVRLAFEEDQREEIEETIKEETIEIKEESHILEREKRLLTQKNTSWSSSMRHSSSGSSKQNNQQQQTLSELELTLSYSFTEGQFICSGSYGQIFQAMDNKSGRIYAVKKINLKAQFEDDDLKMLQQEITLMQRINHKNIVKYIFSVRTPDFQLIYLEYMSQGNLSQLTAKYGPLQEETISVYSKQILEALEYLHSQDIIHRDVKGANLLVDSSGVIKLSDFGCSKLKEKTIKLISSNNPDEQQNAITSLKGSIPYMAPEVIRQETVNFASDIWSFGCTVLEMATAKRPWHEHDFDNFLVAILTIGQSELVPTIPHTLSPQLTSFLTDILQRNHKLRSTATQLLKHPFILRYN